MELKNLIANQSICLIQIPCLTSSIQIELNTIKTRNCVPFKLLPVFDHFQKDFLEDGRDPKLVGKV